MNIINTDKLNLALTEIRRDLIVSVVNTQENAAHFGDNLEIVLSLANALPDLKLNQLSDHSEAIDVLHEKREDVKNPSFYNNDISAEIFKLSELSEMVSTIEHHLDIDDFEVFSDFNEYIKNTFLEANDIPELVVEHTNWEAVADVAAIDYAKTELCANYLFNMSVTTFYWPK